MIYPAAMAAAIGEYLGLTAEEIARGVAAYVPTGSRMHLIRRPENRLIIDDCYNANPQAMAEALRLLARTACASRVAVLGDMGELGELTVPAHEDMGRLCRELGLDRVIAIGPKAGVHRPDGRAKPPNTSIPSRTRSPLCARRSSPARPRSSRPATRWNSAKL